MSQPPELGIGETARRSGLSAPTLRYYEQRGLIRSTRSSGNQRRYPRHILRRLAFITAAQHVGLSLDEIAELLNTLPTDRAPSREDWTRQTQPALAAADHHSHRTAPRPPRHPRRLLGLWLLVPHPLPALQPRRPSGQRRTRLPLASLRRTHTP